MDPEAPGGGERVQAIRLSKALPYQIANPSSLKYAAWRGPVPGLAGSSRAALRLQPG